MKTIGIIPARYASTRFPGKPLAKIAGKSLIERVYRQAEKSDLQKIIVATDDERIAEEVTSFGGNVAITGIHNCGTNRVAEVAKNERCAAVVNIQGDEPLIDSEIINIVSQSLKDNKWADVSTAAVLIDKVKDIENPNIVKVAFSVDGRALYFSRSRIPYSRNSFSKYYKHIGVYGYRKVFLEKFVQLDPSSLEVAESLEQLRVLENGFAIHVSKVDHDSIGVDTPYDISRVEKIIKSTMRNILFYVECLNMSGTGN